MLDNVDRNDRTTWAALTMLEVRMLLARGQTYQARQFAELLRPAAEAGLAVEYYERRDIQQLINAVDSAQAHRSFLALHQLEQVVNCHNRTIRWAAHLWLARVLADENRHDSASAAMDQASALASELPADTVCWTTCITAELQALRGDLAQAERSAIHVLSQFIGWGETRGESLAYLALALVNQAAGQPEDSEAAAMLSYQTDGSWTGPALWLARLALQRDDVTRARELLRSIPNPTTDAYNLAQTLTLMEQQQMPVSAINRILALSQDAPNAASVEGLTRVLEQHNGFVVAHEALAWKLLSLGQPDEARLHLEAMVDRSADIQSIAALRFGLQLAQEQQIFDLLAKPDEITSEDETAQDAELPPPVAHEAPQEHPAADSKTTGVVGQISLFGVPDLLQFFCNSRRSGLLEFSCQRGDAKIRIHEGSLYWAVSPEHPSIAGFLQQRGAATPDQLEQLDTSRDDVGELARRPGVDLDHVRGVLRELIHLTIKELVGWADGWFVFDGIHDPIQPPEELLFNAQGALLDVMRELDEEHR